MSVKKFEFEGSPLRLDAYLPQVLEGYPRSFCKELAKSGAVLVNGNPAKPSCLLMPGDVVEVTSNIHKPSVARLKEMIIVEDRALLAIVKPSGLLVHPLSPAWEQTPELVFSGEDTLVALLLAAYPKMQEKGIDRNGLVHRLDRETSGVMLIAKTAGAQENLVNQFHERSVAKTYLCVVAGRVKDDHGLISVPIGRMAGGKLKASPIGREAVTEYRVLERKKTATLMELYPKTGRTNQLRIHMAWLGHPVLGDRVYKGLEASRLMLHSKQLEFDHPITDKRTVIEAPLPPDFVACWEKVK